MVNRIAGVLEDMENAQNGGADRRMPAQSFQVEGTAEDQLEAAIDALERGARLGLVGSGGVGMSKDLIRHLFAVKQPEPLPEGTFELRGTLFGVEFKADGQLTFDESRQAAHLRRFMEKLSSLMLSAIGQFARKVQPALEAEQRRHQEPEASHGDEEEVHREEGEHDPAKEPGEGEGYGDGEDRSGGAAASDGHPDGSRA